MPRGDRTGPHGFGPNDGPSPGYYVPGYLNPLGGAWAPSGDVVVGGGATGITLPACRAGVRPPFRRRAQLVPRTLSSSRIPVQPWALTWACISCWR